MIIRLLVLSIFGFLSCTVLASDKVEDGSNTVGNANLIVADNRRKGRRDDRQGDRDDKQDCVRKKVSLVMTNANANRKIVATVTKRKVMKRIRMPNLTLEVAR